MNIMLCDMIKMLRGMILLLSGMIIMLGGIVLLRSRAFRCFELCSTCLKEGLGRSKPRYQPLEQAH